MPVDHLLLVAQAEPLRKFDSIDSGAQTARSCNVIDFGCASIEPLREGQRHRQPPRPSSDRMRG